MKPVSRSALYWTPRILAIAYIAFLAVFALDVFHGDDGFWRTAAAFALHLIPNTIVMLVLLIAWRWEHIGGLLFIALGGFYVVWAWGVFPWPTYLVIAAPCALIGVLFILNRAWPISATPRLAH
jgi:hypothetical protein